MYYLRLLSSFSCKYFYTTRYFTILFKKKNAEVFDFFDIYIYNPKCKINFSSLHLISLPIIYKSYKNEYQTDHSRLNIQNIAGKSYYIAWKILKVRTAFNKKKKRKKNEISFEIFVVASRHPCRAEKNHFFTFSVTLPQIPKKSPTYPLYRNKRITNLGSDKKSNQLKKSNILPILHSYETS